MRNLHTHIMILGLIICVLSCAKSRSEPRADSQTKSQGATQPTLQIQTLAQPQSTKARQTFFQSSHRRVLIIGIDGARADVFTRWFNEQSKILAPFFATGVIAHCPKAGSSKCAKTHQGPLWKKGYKLKTGPGWASVLSGVETSRHKVRGNSHYDLSVYSQTSKIYPSFLIFPEL